MYDGHIGYACHFYRSHDHVTEEKNIKDSRIGNIIQYNNNILVL